MKTMFFIIKLYITLILFSFCLMISFTAMAHDVPANNTSVATITGPIMSPLDIRGRLFSNALAELEAGYTAGNMSNVSCTQTASTPTTKSFSCTMINGYSGLPRNTTNTVSGSAVDSYTCPPSSWPDHTVLSGQNCNTPTGEHAPGPDPDPDPLPKPTCESLAGGDANFASIDSNTQLTSLQRDNLQCIRHAGANGQTATACQVIGNAGWIENPIYDDDLSTIIGYRYSPINGSISGYQCDIFGQPRETDQHCVATDDGAIKAVDCPDGSAMSIDMSQFVTIGNQLSTLEGTVAANNAANLLKDASQDYRIDLFSTEAEIIQAIKDDPQLQADLGCTVERLNSQTGAVINCNGSMTNIWDGLNGAIGSTGAKGADGQDGQDGIDGQNGLAGINGQDGDDCTTTDDGVNAIITCGSTMSTLEGIDENGIIEAIQAQTTSLKQSLEYQGDLPIVTFANSENLSNALGMPNDYENRNYGTVIESAVTEMKESPLFTSVETFFEISISGSCPTYSANVPFMNTTITLDQWCQPVMTDIWPIIQAVILIVFSYFGFREAVL